MAASKTRHLDAAISIFRSEGVVKRGHALAIQVSVHHDPKKNEYIVQVGSRAIAEGVGDRAAATQVGEEHAKRLKNLGKKTKVVIY